MTDSDHVDEAELARARGETLPEREALSLLTPDPTLTDTAAVGMLPTTTPTDAGPAAGAAGLAGDTADDFTADASAHEHESVTDADRSESFSSSDSATAGG